MPVSLLKNLITLKEIPFPKMVLITDEVGVSGQQLVEVLVQRLQQQRPVHYVLASPYCRGRSIDTENANIQYYTSTFEDYGVDKCPFEMAVDQILSKSKRKATHSSARLTSLNSCDINSDACNIDYKEEVSVNAAGSIIANNCGSTGFSNNSSAGTANSDSTSVPPVVGSPGDTPQCVLVLERVEDVLLHTTGRRLLGSLSQLTHAGHVVVLWCCAALLPPPLLAALHRTAPASLTLSAAPGGWGAAAAVRLRRGGGKLLSGHEYYSIKNGNVTTAPATDTTLVDTAAVSSGGSGAGSQGRAEAALVHHTTFSLTLTEREKDQKNSLTLPYLRAQQQETMGGVVHYTPDREDWDEEDPDDDLDI